MVIGGHWWSLVVNSSLRLRHDIYRLEVITTSLSFSVDGDLYELADYRLGWQITACAGRGILACTRMTTCRGQRDPRLREDDDVPQILRDAKAARLLMILLIVLTLAAAPPLICLGNPVIPAQAGIHQPQTFFYAIPNFLRKLAPEFKRTGLAYSSACRNVQ